MPDFSQLLRRPAVESKRPPALIADDYQGIIKGYALGDENRNKTPYVRFQLGLTDWGPSVPESWEAHDPNTNKSYTVMRSDIDLSKRQFRRDFFLTPDALWRLKEMLESCGIKCKEESDGTIDYAPLIPQAIGQPVTVEIQQYLNQQSNEIGNQVGRVVGQSAG